METDRTAGKLVVDHTVETAARPPARTEKPLLSVYWGLPFGVVSGVLSGALNEGGPPIVVYLLLLALAFQCMSLYLGVMQHVLYYGLFPYNR